MTVQVPDILERDAGAMELPGMPLYAVMVGDIDDLRSCAGYRFRFSGTPSKITPCTALWRGHVSIFRLRTDGTLLLESVAYPFTPDAQPDVVNEELIGDFWLDMREHFNGGGIRLPFRDGRIVTDTSQWRSLS